MRYQVETHKVRQITVIRIIYIKLCIFRQRNDRKNSAISTLKQWIKQSNTYCKSTVYTVSPVPHQKLKALMV